jgi:hypothetical protein
LRPLTSTSRISTLENLELLADIRDTRVVTEEFWPPNDMGFAWFLKCNRLGAVRIRSRDLPHSVTMGVEGVGLLEKEKEWQWRRRVIT